MGNLLALLVMMHYIVLGVIMLLQVGSIGLHGGGKMIKDKEIVIEEIMTKLPLYTTEVHKLRYFNGRLRVESISGEKYESQDDGKTWRVLEEL